MTVTRTVLLFLILLATILFAPTGAAQTQLATGQSVEAKKQAERFNEQRLSALMSAAGIQVDPATRVTSGPFYRSLRLQLTTNTAPNTSSNSLAQSFSSNVNSSERRAGELPRHRSYELSSQHLVVVTVDSLNRLRWWSLIPDPRILRAEEPDGQSRLSGGVIYQANIETIVEIPDDTSARELRFYHPQWTDDRFVLTLVSAIALNKN